MEELDRQYTYIVGVSGGCDSMYLLDHLYKQHYSIVVCHVDYGIRHDTDEDYQIVYEYTKKHQIPFFFKKVESYKGGNFQDEARNIRYDFFEEIGKQYHTNKVVVAHHKDDVIETILLQKQRDTKRLYLGLKRISTVRNCEVYRILLDTTKAEILDYCNQNKLAYHDDYTNFQTHYQRDYIRNMVLKEYCEKEKENLLEEARIHNEALEKRKEYILSIIKEPFDYRTIQEEDLEDVLYYMCEPYIHRISNSLLEELKRTLKSPGNIKIDLPVNFVFIKEYYSIYIQKKKFEEDYEYTIQKGELIQTPYFHIELTGHPYDGIGLSDDDFPLTIRNFRNGDLIETKIGYKKVSRVFIDRKIPASKRKTWPIVLNAKGEIILIPHIMKKFSYFHIKENIFVVKY